ncbi:MAG TPA: ATP synthase F1 subunit delta [Pirellulaceae bacterium]
MTDSQSKSETIDAGRQHLGTVYAKALLGAAENAGQADTVVDELEAIISDVLNKLPVLNETLKTPRLTAEERLPIIDKAFGGRVSPTTLTFLKVVSNHGRLDCLRAIARAARKQLNAARGRVEVKVETAYPLSNPIRERIANRLRELLGQEVILNADVNEDLLGGLVVRVGDTVYDASLAARLKRMEQVALDHTKQSIRESIERFAMTT